VSGAVGALWAIARGEPPTEADLDALRAYDQPPRDGLRLQLEVLDRWRGAGGRLGGWKIGWTSRGARDRGGAGSRPFGYVLSSHILESGSTLDVSRVPGAGAIEPEICVTIGTRLAGPDVTPEQARAAVSSVAPAFEIIRRGLPSGLSLAARIGNAMNNGGIVVGSPHDPGLDLSRLDVSLSRDGAVIATASSGPDVLDDPYTSVARVCAELHACGLALEPGQQVITGSITASEPLSPLGMVEARFGALGTVSVTLV
jgi:2-keto-4-pentenoate hydratase